MDSYGLFTGAFGLILALLFLLLGILWLLVPFAVFGIKGLLKDLIQEQRRTNAILAGDAAQPGSQIEANADRPTLKNILAEVRKP